MTFLQLTKMNYNAYLYATVIFLLTRYVIKHKAYPENWMFRKKLLETEETLYALRDINALFMNSITPLYISYRVFLFDIPDKYAPVNTMRMQLIFIMFSSTFTFVVNFMLTFVSYKKGCKCWFVIAPYLYLGLCWSAYLILPALNFIGSVVTLILTRGDSSQSYLKLWIITYMIFEVMIFVNYFFKLRKFYVKEIYAHLWLHEKMKSDDFEQNLLEYIGHDELKLTVQ